MTDQFGRTIEYMRVSVTDRCNLRCVYCMPKEGVPTVGHANILTFQEIERLCRVGVRLGIRRIKLTGGEPLVRRDLPRLVEMLNGTDGIEQVTLTTNGTLLSGQINELVSKGIKNINISIDTLDEERYFRLTRGGRLSDALAGLEAALSYPQVHVKVNTVPFSPEEDEGQDAIRRDCVALAALAKDRNVEVRFIELMPIGQGRCGRGMRQEEILALLESVYGKSEAYGQRLGNGPAAYVTFPQFRGRIGFISAVSHKFCGDCNRVRLTSEGYLKPCLQYDTGVDLRRMLREGATDAELERAMAKAIGQKPACHCFFEEETGDSSVKSDGLEKKGMSSIGG